MMYRLKYFTYKYNDEPKVTSKDIPVSKNDLDCLERLDAQEDIFAFLNGIVIKHKDFISLERIDEKEII